MFIRNGLRGGYTFMEAIENVLPFVDEFYILDGASDDGTLGLLRSLAANDPKIRLDSRLPEYVSAPKEKRGLLLGAAFEEARQACSGDWLVQVQADTVFHPVTLLAVSDFLKEKGSGWTYDAIEIVRKQYRWNWQDMYRRDNLALIFRKDAGEVTGDALNISIKGKISARFVPLFERFPAADNAWIFFENIAGKQLGCREIWATPENHGNSADFPWYDRATGRSFSADLEAYVKTNELPPFWKERATPFKDELPANLAALVGHKKYEVAERFNRKNGMFSPGAEDLAILRAAAGNIKAPFKEKAEEFLESAGFGAVLKLIRRIIRRSGKGQLPAPRK